MHEFFQAFGEMSAFEIGMMLCFSASWPFSIAKTLKVKSGGGKSSIFMGLLIAGYAFGIIHKYLYKFDAVVLLYAFNLLLVLTDLSLCIYFGKKEKGKKCSSQKSLDTQPQQ